MLVRKRKSSNYAEYTKFYVWIGWRRKRNNVWNTLWSIWIIHRCWTNWHKIKYTYLVFYLLAIYSMQLTVEQMVEKIMIACPKTRNSNTAMLIEILNQFWNCWLSTQQQEIMMKFPLESITRARRKLVSTGKKEYQPDEEIQRERNDAFQEKVAQYGGGRAYCEWLIRSHKAQA